MRTVIRTMLAMCTLVLGVQAGLGQKKGAISYSVYSPDQPQDVSKFEIKMYNTASDFASFSRLNLELRFDNDDLQFIKTKDKGFRADYEVEVKLFDHDSTEVEFSTWMGSALADDFKQTTSKNTTIVTRGAIEAPPGQYKFSVGLQDKETRRTGYLLGQISLRDFSSEMLAVSDIWFVDSVASLSKKPASESSDQTKLFARLEIYNASDSVDVSYKILNDTAEVTEHGSQKIASEGRITPYLLEVPRKDYSNQLHFISLHINCNGDSVFARQTISPAFAKVQPKFVDLTDAINKLTYIADEKRLKAMQAADKEQQSKLFHDFWKERDPTPMTDDNEYMTEYYSRINRANQLIRGQGQDGWRTEMGRVYVMMGPPDDIQQIATNNSSFTPSFTGGATMLWQYYDLRRRVIFEYKFGEYRIANYSEVFDLLNGEMLF